MMSEEQKAIKSVKFCAMKCREIDEELHQLDLRITKLRIELIATESLKNKQAKELYKYNRKLRQMVIEL
jgi:hypothetical protein